MRKIIFLTESIQHPDQLKNIVSKVKAHVDKYDDEGSNQNCLFSTWSVEL
jgi:hypothetical protein